MGEEKGLLPLNSHPAVTQLLVSLLLILLISAFILLLSLMTGRLIFGASAGDLDISNTTIIESQRAYLKFIQTMSQLAVFLLPGLVISWFMTKNISKWLGLREKISFSTALIVIFLAVSLLPLTSLTGIINSRMELPGWLHPVEQWMMRQEKQALDLTSHLLYAKSPGGMMVNLFILALVPAVGEEMLFRGVIQQIFQKWFRSGIAAVLVTAFIFSTLHLQFYGFIPRFILGIVFGLLFLWSRSLWLPFIAHMVNNSVPVIISYYSGWENLNDNIGEYVPTSAGSIIVMIVLPAVLLYLVRDSYRKR